MRSTWNCSLWSTNIGSSTESRRPSPSGRRIGPAIPVNSGLSAGLHQIRLPSWSYVESIRRCSARRTPATGLADRGEIAGGREAAITTTYFGSFDLAADDVFDISLT